MINIKTAACYIRVSTDDQTEYSPESQLKAIRDFAAKNDISLIEDYIFMEDGGKSGKNMSKRSEFLNLISLTKKHKKPFDVILVWKFSRFARNQEESIVLKSMLKKNGIDVISISESIPEGPFGSLIERIIEWSDEYYLINLSQEVKRGMKERASRGEPVTAPPLGYDLKDNKYVPNTDATYVKNIYSDYLNGIGLRAIATKYGNLGLRTKRGNMPDNRFIEYMLRNPTYTGKIRWSLDGRAASKRHFDDPNIAIYDGTHEPIIDIKTFEAVQKKLDEQKLQYGKYQRPEQRINYMLKGLVRCSVCGATLVAINNKCPSLQCHNYARGKCHTSHCISVKKINTAVIEYLQNCAVSGFDFIINPRNVSVHAPEVDYARILQNEENKLEKIKLAYLNGVDTLEEYKNNKEQITSFINKVKNEMRSSLSTPTKQSSKELFREKIVSVLSVLTDENASEERKSTALRSIIEKIVYNKSQKNIEIYFYE